MGARRVARKVATRRSRPADAAAPWRSRITRHGSEAPARLKANPANWRRHPPRQQDAMAGMLGEVGWVQSVVVNERTGHLIDGHLRVELALKRKEPRVPVVYVDLAPDEERLVLAALDPIGGMAATDPEALRSLLGTAEANDLALRSLLEDLAAAAAPSKKTGKTEPDAAPQLPEHPYVARGELYELGGHRLLCGDATNVEDLKRLLGPVRPDVVFTDPPPNTKKKRGAKEEEEPAFVRLILASMRLVLEVLRPGGSYYVAMSALAYPLVAYQLRKIGAGGRPIVWAKPSPGVSAQDYRPQFEVILYGVAGSRSLRTWHGDRKASDLWTFDPARGVVAREGPGPGMTIEVGAGVETVQLELEQRSAGRVMQFDGAVSDLWRFSRDSGAAYLHPTQKPVALVERALGNSSNVGGSVLDVFLGSGTTLIAAEQLERRCFALELDPKYAQVALERWQTFTGRKARKVA